MKRTLAYGIAIGAIFLIGIAVGRVVAPTTAAGDGGSEGQTSAAQALLTVSVITAQERGVADHVSAVGRLVPRENVLVIPELAGRRILSVHADVGDYVRRGQLLATIDGQDLQIDIQSLKSEFERTREEHERAKTLQASQLVSREFLKQKQASLEQARSQLEDAKLQVHRTRIVAPAEGLIYRRTATIGGLTDGTEALFSIVEKGRVEMQAEVPEAMADRLKPGMTVTLRIGGGDRAVDGRIRLIAPQVEGQSRATLVRIELPADMTPAVGTFSEARIEVGDIGGWVVPSKSLQQDTQGHYLWQVDAKHQVKRVPVTVILQTADDVVVRESLGGLRIVAKAGALLQDNDTVALTKSDAT